VLVVCIVVVAQAREHGALQQVGVCVCIVYSVNSSSSSSSSSTAPYNPHSHTYIHTYIRTHTHTHTHIHSHTHTHTLTCNSVKDRIGKSMIEEAEAKVCIICIGVVCSICVYM
jgi:hypothetical protein